MTREEAREILEKLIPQPQRGDGKSITHLMITEALTMAIKALEQQPCEYKPLIIDKPKDEDMQELLRTFQNQKVLVAEHDCLPSVTLLAEPCDDCISREEAEAIFKNARKSLYELSRKERVKDFQTREMMLLNAEQFIHLLPSVTPKFTDEEIQKMQELEQAQLDKAYELGKAEMQPCEDCISRQAVIDTIDFEDKWLHDASGHNANTKIAFSGIKSRVKALPSVTPKTGSEK